MAILHFPFFPEKKQKKTVKNHQNNIRFIRVSSPKTIGNGSSPLSRDPKVVVSPQIIENWSEEGSTPENRNTQCIPGIHSVFPGSRGIPSEKKKKNNLKEKKRNKNKKKVNTLKSYKSAAWKEKTGKTARKNKKTLKAAAFNENQKENEKKNRKENEKKRKTP